MEDRVERLRRKLAASGKRLNPCLDRRAIEAFESRHRIGLPQEYRDYLLRIGDGGEGPPHCGVPRLGKPGRRDMGAEERAFWSELPRVSEPFPFTKAWCWEDGDESDEGVEDQVGCGSLYVGHEGCGQYWHLIVNGPERGRVWQFSAEGICPTEPGRDFLQWYEDWLDGVVNWWS